jgi:cation diffusion facilitator CzcD-associated flavoprotein CzcO
MGDMAEHANYTFTLPEKAIDDDRKVKVICVGAGFSGVCTAIRFPQKIPNLSLTIYEKNADLGGTWFENRCDCARVLRLGMSDLQTIDTPG